MNRQTRTHKRAGATSGLSTHSLSSTIGNKRKNLILGRCRFPLEELGDIPEPPKVRLNRYDQYKPRDKAFIDGLIFQILTSIRTNQIIYKQAVSLVSNEIGGSYGNINNRFASYATEDEQKAADVLGAMRLRRFNKLREILNDNNVKCKSFTDACRLVAENEFIGEITQVDIVSIIGQFQGMADDNLRELVYQRWPHIGLGRDRD
ncbi:MAG: hypothetical protein WAZ18_00920 [Alphaproteobacteria bacterium]